jgi:hypothetical protein
MLVRGLLCVACNAFVGKYENPKDSMFKEGSTSLTMNDVWPVVHLSTRELKARIEAYLDNPPARLLMVKYQPDGKRRRKIRKSINLSKEAMKIVAELGLNISQVAEIAVHGAAFPKDKRASEVVVRSAYRKLFDAMQPSLELYNPQVLVGLTRPDLEDGDWDEKRVAEGPEPLWYFLTKETLWKNENHEELDSAEGISLDAIEVADLLPADKIIEDLMRGIAKSSKSNEATVRELNMARRVIDAITQQLTPPTKTGQATK